MTCVDEFTVNVAVCPLKATAVVSVKFTPVITTLVLAGPLVGENPVIRGATANGLF